MSRANWLDNLRYPGEPRPSNAFIYPDRARRMGLTSTDLSLLIELRKRRSALLRVATVGRLTLHVHPREIAQLVKLYPKCSAIRSYRWGDNAEGVLKTITGAHEIVSIDYSDYEGATVVHDMNAPIGASHPELIGQFDLVIDGGTLEHVFNVPMALGNVMDLCRIDGFVLMANPSNNLCGHGFYQFSPELMYRVFSEANGFCIEKVLLTVCKVMSVERDPHPRSYQVADPANTGRRIMIRNRRPVVIRTLAKKISSVGLNYGNVQQSDYSAMWADAQSAHHRRSPTENTLRLAFQKMPFGFQTLLLDWRARMALRSKNVMSQWKGPLE
jgi:hypothetical protein